LVQSGTQNNLPLCSTATQAGDNVKGWSEQVEFNEQLNAETYSLPY